MKVAKSGPASLHFLLISNAQAVVSFRRQQNLSVLIFALFIETACRCLPLPIFGCSPSFTVPFLSSSQPQDPNTHRASNTRVWINCSKLWVVQHGVGVTLLRLWQNWNSQLVELIPGVGCSKENSAQTVVSTLQSIFRQPAPMGSSGSAECAGEWPQKSPDRGRAGPPALGARAGNFPYTSLAYYRQWANGKCPLRNILGRGALGR